MKATGIAVSSAEPLGRRFLVGPSLAFESWRLQSPRLGCGAVMGSTDRPSTARFVFFPIMVHVRSRGPCFQRGLDKNIDFRIDRDSEKRAGVLQYLVTCPS